LWIAILRLAALQGRFCGYDGNNEFRLFSRDDRG
jgi:hypothetical protein